MIQLIPYQSAEKEIFCLIDPELHRLDNNLYLNKKCLLTKSFSSVTRAMGLTDCGRAHVHGFLSAHECDTVCKGWA